MDSGAWLATVHGNCKELGTTEQLTLLLRGNFIPHATTKTCCNQINKFTKKEDKRYYQSACSQWGPKSLAIHLPPGNISKSPLEEHEFRARVLEMSVYLSSQVNCKGSPCG